MKGCCSINEPFCTDSFLDCGMIFTGIFAQRPHILLLLAVLRLLSDADEPDTLTFMIGGICIHYFLIIWMAPQGGYLVTKDYAWMGNPKRLANLSKPSLP